MSVGKFRAIAHIIAVIAGVLSLPGCAKKNEFETAKVSGKVLYKSEPIHTGSLVFVPVGGGPPSQGKITDNGTFTMGTYTQTDGAIPGQHKVMITAFTSPGGSGLPEDAINGNAEPVSVIPEIFSDLEKSGLIVDVKPGSNEITFELSADSGKVVMNQ